jgi:ferrous iron transport protein B
VIVGTFGLIYDVGDVDAKAVGDDSDAGAVGLKEAVRKEWGKDPVRGKYGVAVALSVMVFIALCLQCVSTLAVIRRETRSWAWPAFTFAYMTALAYLGALVTFQVGRLITDMV